MINTHLQVFAMVAEKKSFSRAAEALRLTQPAISQQIHTLEEYYGTKLFERTSKRVELTAAGETLLPYAKQILDLSAKSKGALDDLMGRVTGKLTIGATFTIGEYILPQVLAEYTQRFPEVELNMLIHNTEEIGEMMLDYSIDAGVVEGRLQHRHLTLTPFLDDEVVLFAPPSHPLARSAAVRAEQLEEHAFILREAGSGTRATAEDYLQKIGVEPRKVISIGSTQGIKEAVEAGMGLAILSQWCVRRELQTGSLKRLTVDAFRYSRPLSVLERAGRFQSRAASEFVSLVQHYAYPKA
ncbi:DNA-binding transcriptional LysR family regulator [Tumebacillus sp. BK434]|uniref:LysR family transcriptional regulator n=1 Tax=Tumebacillus sp. BK434 TaxID=2512169 RepID=UPI0010459A35|nr:LysR family transcriptional regulator [Tumebacillus sp. BK434]TCP55568.1 DNA-binding transcriptional LysR family regulator [Tumebacillus sp. BK434]